MARFDETTVHEVVERLDLLARYMPPAYAFAGAVTGFTIGVVFSGGSLAFGILGATMVAGAGFGVAVEKTLRIRLETQVALALVEQAGRPGEAPARTTGPPPLPPPQSPSQEHDSAASTFPCLSCGGPVPAGRTICPACSTDNSRREGCPDCGALRQSPTQRACRKCGRSWD